MERVNCLFKRCSEHRQRTSPYASWRWWHGPYGRVGHWSLINAPLPPPSHTGTDPLIASAPCALNAIMFTSNPSFLTSPVKAHVWGRIWKVHQLLIVQIGISDNKQTIIKSKMLTKDCSASVELGGLVKSYRMRLNDRRSTAHTWISAHSCKARMGGFGN